MPKNKHKPSKNCVVISAIADDDNQMMKMERRNIEINLKCKNYVKYIYSHLEIPETNRNIIKMPNILNIFLFHFDLHFLAQKTNKHREKIVLFDSSIHSSSSNGTTDVRNYKQNLKQTTNQPLLFRNSKNLYSKQKTE